MKTFHVLDEVDNANSGPCYSVSSLVRYINNDHTIDAEIIIPKNTSRYTAKNFHIQEIPNHVFINPFRFSGSNDHFLSLIRGNNILHGHGIWRSCNLFYLLRRKNDSSKFICSPRGMLARWAMNYKKIRKLPFWYALQKPALNKVDCFHATAESELEDIRRLGFRQPVAVIPNGVDFPLVNQTFDKKNIILFLGRIHKIKGLSNLVSAWKSLEEIYPNWKLVIAGPLDEPYAEKLQNEVKILGLRNIEFVGAVDGTYKEALFGESKLLVLPSFSENFGIVVAESLVRGVPVITTTGTPWSNVKERKCGWYIKPNVNSLINALNAGMSLDSDDLSAMGDMGRKWMTEEFGWEKIASDMILTYQWLDGTRSVRPIFVDVCSG